MIGELLGNIFPIIGVTFPIWGLYLLALAFPAKPKPPTRQRNVGGNHDRGQAP